MLMQSLKTTLLMFAALTVIAGVIYPAVVTGLAKIAFDDKANGSLIIDNNGRVRGSTLIGQSFADPRYFWGRLSATSPVPYNASASGGSNLGAAAPNLETAIKARLDILHAAQPDSTAPVPADLVTASGSGLDPHISFEAADYQASRIAQLRGIEIEQVRALIQKHTDPRQLGLLGEQRVNVLELNLALDGITTN